MNTIAGRIMFSLMITVMGGMSGMEQKKPSLHNPFSTLMGPSMLGGGAAKHKKLAESEQRKKLRKATVEKQIEQLNNKECQWSDFPAEIQEYIKQQAQEFKLAEKLNRAIADQTKQK